MSSPMINSLAEATYQLGKRLEESNNRLIVLAENIERLPDLIEKQGQAQIDAFYQQNHFNGMLVVNKIAIELKKYHHQLNEQKNRIAKQMEYYRKKVVDVCTEYDTLITKLKEKEKNRVLDLDSKAYEFISKVNNGNLNYLVSDFEVPFYDKIRAEEKVVFSYRLSNLIDRIEDIEDAIELLSTMHHEFVKSIESLFQHEMLKDQENVGIEFIDTVYSVDGQTYNEFILPSSVEKAYNSFTKRSYFIFEPVIDLDKQQIDLIRSRLIDTD